MQNNLDCQSARLITCSLDIELYFINFKKAMCKVIGFCRWEGGRNRERKLTHFTSNNLIIITEFNFAASTQLLDDHHFHRVLPAVSTQNTVKFLCKENSV